MTEFTNIAKATVLFPKTADSFITHGSFTVSERASIALHWKQEHGRKLRKLGEDSKHTKPFTYATQGRSTCEEAIHSFFFSCSNNLYCLYIPLCTSNNKRNSNHLPYWSSWSGPGDTLAGQEIFKCCYKALWSFPSQRATRMLKSPLIPCLSIIYKNGEMQNAIHLQ